jgi:hypothetical protein
MARTLHDQKGATLSSIIDPLLELLDSLYEAEDRLSSGVSVDTAAVLSREPGLSQDARLLLSKGL